MNRYLVILSALLCSCAAPKVAPRFTVPSTAAIGRSHHEAISHVAKAQAIVKTLTIRLPADKVKVDALTRELDSAQMALKTSEDQRAALDKELQAQTTKANKLADNYDKLNKENDRNKAVVEQVDSYWGLGAFAYGAQRLARHLFWAAVIGISALLLLFVLSFFFPALGAGLKLTGAVIARAARAVTSILNRKHPP